MIKDEKQSEIQLHDKYPKSHYFKFQIGDLVRLSAMKYVFSRIYHQRWSNEVFKITERFVRQDQNMYNVKDGRNKELEGKMYEHEMLKVELSQDPVFRISKVHKVTKNMMYVSWEGHSRLYDSWIKKSDVKSIN